MFYNSTNYSQIEQVYETNEHSFSRTWKRQLLFPTEPIVTLTPNPRSQYIRIRKATRLIKQNYLNGDFLMMSGVDVACHGIRYRPVRLTVTIGLPQLLTPIHITTNIGSSYAVTISSLYVDVVEHMNNNGRSESI